VKAAGLVLLVVAAGYFGGLQFWPFALNAPLSNPFKSLSYMSDFSTSIKMLFEGRHLWSDELPWYYIPKWMAIGSPLYLIGGVVLLPILLWINRRSSVFIYAVLLTFTAVFPVSYAVIQGSSLYDGMRHFLFVIPVLGVLGAWSWNSLSKLLPLPALQYGIYSVLLILLLLPTQWMFRNHPYQSVYFNEAFGGAKAAYGHYEMDYWMNSMKEMCEWLVENDPDIKAGKEKTILTSSMDPVSYYMRQLAPNVKVEYVRYTDRHAKAGDYFFFFNRFVDRGLLLSGAWPPGDLVYEVKVDDTPIAAITRTEPNGFSVKGKASATQQDTDGAIQWYAQAVAVDPKDELAWNGLAQAYLDRQRWAETKQALDQLFTLSDSEFGTWYLLGQYHYNQGQVEEAKKAFEMCKSLNYKQNLTYYFLAAIAGNQNDPAAVVRHIEDYDRNGGNLGQVFDLGIAAAGQLSLPAPARYFEAKKALFSGDAQRAFQLMGEALARDPNYEPALLLRNQFQAN
ncbi:MAG: tetratricopeptide repeat protein, partial [Saprospiraceae bacterium]|nr:tetratricopeptide repeat protein [Saprospiraceae bacterium]